MSFSSPAQSAFLLQPSSAASSSSLPTALRSTRSTGSAIPELAGLSPDDVDLLDEVIERAGPNSTTFLTVFRAYNDVLQERGLDPHEVVYYARLLKLGTLRGRNWKEKWHMVKLQHGYGGIYGTRTTNPVILGTMRAARLNTHLDTPRREEDTFTAHSYQDNTELIDTDTSLAEETPQYHLTPPLFHSLDSPASKNSSKLASDLELSPSAHRTKPFRAKPFNHIPSSLVKQKVDMWDDHSSDIFDLSVPVTPPSYKTAVRDPILRNEYVPRSKDPLSSALSIRSFAQQHLKLTRERRADVVSEDDPWHKVKAFQDEKDADLFREDRLVDRCWQVWKQNYQWTRTTEHQIDQARAKILLRDNLLRWRTRAAAHIQRSQKADILARDHLLKTAFRAWRIRLQEKQLADWRNSMRSKIHVVKVKRDARLRRKAWIQWRRSHQSQLSERHHAGRLVLRMYEHWRKRLFALESLAATTDEFRKHEDERLRERCWEFWKNASLLKHAERVTMERVAMRVTNDVLHIWKRRMRDNRIAETFQDALTKRRMLRSWKTALDRIATLEGKATKHQARQDDLLTRAVWRVWKARSRAPLLERVRAARLLEEAMAVWKSRLRNMREREALALSFYTRPSSSTNKTALRMWLNVSATHRNAHSFAVRYHSEQLQYKALLAWRLQLREVFKAAKKARTVYRFFIARRVWVIWCAKFRERRRAKALQKWERTKLKKLFCAWVALAQRKRRLRLAEQAIQSRVVSRICATYLSCWTNRVIDLKLRELDAVQRYEREKMISAYYKWRAVRKRHAEELRLMESYQEVKREESVRRMFHHWLSAARASRYRRATLRQKEDEVTRACLSIVWDRWRDRFCDERLRPIENQFLIQNQHCLLYQFFAIWRSKTKALPAIKFHALHVKIKHWQVWREAMPRALQVRAARETCQKATLSRFMGKWVQAHRTKIALKAVARARYLRLPAAVPRLSKTPDRPQSTPVIPATFPRRALRAELSPTHEGASHSRTSRPTPRFEPRMGGPRSEAGESELRSERPGRAPSPTPSRASFSGFTDRRARNGSGRPMSIGGGEEGRSKLLRELQKTSRRP